MAVVGAALGWPMALSALLGVSLAGGVQAAAWLLAARIRGRERPRYVPYAVARWYLKFLADDTRVRDLVAIAPPNHVTRLKHACPLLCTQLNRGTIIRRLNRGGELLAGVDYTVIESAVDGAIVPYTAAFLHGPRRQLTNVLVQRTCPFDHADHIGLLFLKADTLQRVAVWESTDDDDQSSAVRRETPNSSAACCIVNPAK